MRRLFLSLATALALATPAAAQGPGFGPARPAMIYSVEQIVSPRLSPVLLEKLKPIHTLGEVEDLLKANAIPFTWRRTEVDNSTMPPAVVAQIETLPPGEVFVLPQGESLVYNVILARRLKPVG